MPVLASLCERRAYVQRAHIPLLVVCLWHLTRVYDPWSYGSHPLRSSEDAPHAPSDLHSSPSMMECTRLVVLAIRLPGGPLSPTRSLFVLPLHVNGCRPSFGSLVPSPLCPPSPCRWPPSVLRLLVLWSPGLGPRSSCSASPRRWDCSCMLLSAPWPWAYRHHDGGILCPQALWPFWSHILLSRGQALLRSQLQLIPRIHRIQGIRLAGSLRWSRS